MVTARVSGGRSRAGPCGGRGGRVADRSGDVSPSAFLLELWGEGSAARSAVCTPTPRTGAP